MIRVKTFLLIAVLLSSKAFAQNPQQQGDAERYRMELAERQRQEAEQRDWETKIFAIKFVDPNELRIVLQMFRSNINYSGGSLRVLSVRAPKEIMPAIEDTIKRLDVPSPNRDAELTIFILLASDQAEGTAVPANLQPVVNQLKGVLSYKNYQLLDTLISHVTESGQTNLTGTVTVGTDRMPINYNFQSGFRVERPEGKPPILRVRGMRFQFRTSGSELAVATDVDVPQGQQVVVGKATMGDKALILVMTSKFSN